MPTDPPKFKTRNEAFKWYRGQGIDVFDWNGKKFNTMLAGEKPDAWKKFLEGKRAPVTGATTQQTGMWAIPDSDPETEYHGRQPIQYGAVPAGDPAMPRWQRMSGWKPPAKESVASARHLRQPWKGVDKNKLYDTAAFASNFVNSFRRPPGGQLSQGVTTVPTQRVQASIQPLINSYLQQRAAADRSLDENTAAAVGQGLYERKLNAVGELGLKTAQLNAQLSDAGAQRAMIAGIHNSRQQQEFLDNLANREMVDISMDSANLANAADKYIALRNRDVDTQNLKSQVDMLMMGDMWGTQGRMWDRTRPFYEQPFGEGATPTGKKKKLGGLMIKKLYRLGGPVVPKFEGGGKLRPDTIWVPTKNDPKMKAYQDSLYMYRKGIDATREGIRKNYDPNYYRSDKEILRGLNPDPDNTILYYTVRDPMYGSLVKEGLKRGIKPYGNYWGNGPAYAPPKVPVAIEPQRTYNLPPVRSAIDIKQIQSRAPMESIMKMPVIQQQGSWNATWRNLDGTQGTQAFDDLNSYNKFRALQDPRDIQRESYYGRPGQDGYRTEILLNRPPKFDKGGRLPWPKMNLNVMPGDNTRVAGIPTYQGRVMQPTYDVESQQRVAQFKKEDAEILAARKNAIAEGDKLKGQSFSFDGNKAKVYGNAAAERFRLFPNDPHSMFDDYINPLVGIGGLAQGIGTMLGAENESDVYSGALTTGLGFIGGALSNLGPKKVPAVKRSKVLIPKPDEQPKKVTPNPPVQTAMDKFTHRRLAMEDPEIRTAINESFDNTASGRRIAADFTQSKNKRMMREIGDLTRGESEGRQVISDMAKEARLLNKDFVTYLREQIPDIDDATISETLKRLSPDEKEALETFTQEVYRELPRADLYNTKLNMVKNGRTEEPFNLIQADMAGSYESQYMHERSLGSLQKRADRAYGPPMLSPELEKAMRLNGLSPTGSPLTPSPNDSPLISRIKELYNGTLEQQQKYKAHNMEELWNDRKRELQYIVPVTTTKTLKMPWAKSLNKLGGFLKAK